jgi:hypothetical protein
VGSQAQDKKASLSEHEKSALKPLYDTFDDFLELVIFFGYASMFSVAFPLAPLIVLVNTFIGCRLDAFKVFYEYRRPPPSGAQDIG